MIEGKIQEAIMKLNKLREEFKVLKKTIRDMEKIKDVPEYTQLKDALKQLKAQVKQFEEEYNADLAKDNEYQELIRLKEEKEEEVADASEKLQGLLLELPQKPVELKFETEDGFVNVNVIPEMRLYVNGKEEKPRRV